VETKINPIHLEKTQHIVLIPSYVFENSAKPKQNMKRGKTDNLQKLEKLLLIQL
jgi:hypothetical protein